METPIKYFLYARKSTDEPTRQILSIAQQLFELRAFAEQNKLNVIRDTPKSLDSLIALGSLARELWYTARHVGAWEAKYAAEFPRPRTAAP